MRTSRAVLLLGCFYSPTDGRAISISITPQDCVRGAMLFGAGDVAAQWIERGTHDNCHERSLRLRRLASASAIGTLWGGVLLPSVYGLAESLLPGLSPQKVVLKTLISCSLLSTGGNYASLLLRRMAAPTCKLPGTESVPERLLRVCDSLNEIFADVLLNDLRVWPAYDLLCFSVVPPAHRPTSTALVSVCWHTYMSLRASMSTSAHA